MGAVQFTVDHPIQQHLPVGLGLQGDVQTLVFEETLFIGDGQGRHIGELDKAELQFLLLRLRGHGQGGE